MNVIKHLLTLEPYQLIIICMPFVLAVTYVIWTIHSEKKRHKYVETIYQEGQRQNDYNKSKELIRELDKITAEKTFIERKTYEMQRVGMNKTYTQYIYAGMGLGAVLTLVLGIVCFQCGPLLLLYLFLLGMYIPQIALDFQLYKARDELKIEFFHFLQNVSTQLTAGNMFENAFERILSSSEMSPIMGDEIRGVITSHKSGNSFSECFMKMYANLGIEEIKDFADSMAMFETSGSDINASIKAQVNYFFTLREIDDVRRLQEKKLNRTLKLMVAIPIALLVGVKFFAGDFFGDFFQTLLGQIASMISFSVMAFGVLYTKHSIRLKD